MARFNPTSITLLLPLMALLLLAVAFFAGSFVGQGHFLPIMVVIAVFFVGLRVWKDFGGQKSEIRGPGVGDQRVGNKFARE